MPCAVHPGGAQTTASGTVFVQRASRTPKAGTIAESRAHTPAREKTCREVGPDGHAAGRRGMAGPFLSNAKGASQHELLMMVPAEACSSLQVARHLYIGSVRNVSISSLGSAQVALPHGLSCECLKLALSHLAFLIFRGLRGKSMVVRSCSDRVRLPARMHKESDGERLVPVHDLQWCTQSTRIIGILRQQEHTFESFVRMFAAESRSTRLADVA